MLRCIVTVPVSIFAYLITFIHVEPCLSSSDLKVVYKELFDVRAKWRRIGIELNLTPGTLDAIRQMESDPAERLERVLLEWMNKGSATWRELVDTLYSVPVGETKLAELLEQKYHCFQSRSQYTEF